MESFVESWENALLQYNWTVNLRNFKSKAQFNGYFNQIIDKNNVQHFEDKFRSSLDSELDFTVSGEVCYWKNYGSFRSRDELTAKLLTLLSEPANWQSFVCDLTELATNPTYENIDRFRITCGQPNGFATPVTFLSFYNPKEFPMVDRIIGDWWNANSPKFSASWATPFAQREDGWLPLNKQNWSAYLEWRDFCSQCALLLTLNSERHWRARDVEMAVWEAEKRKLALESPLGQGEKELY
jgi:hypothetical protein